ncbi:MAG TPA: hypothetical protein VFD51_00395 [Patescibacteria group bacterium]|nr:hypothetical protein [Patescibacteria group bacterium]
MNKKSIKVIIFLAVIVLIGFIFYFLNKTKDNDGSIVNQTEDNNSQEGVINEELPIDPKTAASMEAMAREMPFPGLDGLGLEFMNEKEKEEFRVQSSIEAQIITRNDEGAISAYKIIKQPEDILYQD